MEEACIGPACIRELFGAQVLSEIRDFAAQGCNVGLDL